MKKWYLSRLIWVGIITVIFGALKYSGVISVELDEGTLAAVLGVIVTILRLVTKTEVVLK